MYLKRLVFVVKRFTCNSAVVILVYDTDTVSEQLHMQLGCGITGVVLLSETTEGTIR